MKYLVNSAQMRECDRNTSEYYKVPSIVLMERAALAVAECVNEMLEKKGGTDQRILILCGTGNNGADGLAVARLLYQQGYEVHIYQAGKNARRSELHILQTEICRAYGMVYTDDVKACKYAMVVDALFGVGLSRDLDAENQMLTEKVNALGCPILSVDIPSGIHADSGRIMGAAIKADVTVTFGFEKIGMYRYPGKLYCGKIRTAPIGITEASFLGKMPEMILAEEKDVARWWPKRYPDGNKGTFGKVLIMAGQKDMAGACILAARSCYRMGAGMVQILTCEENREILQQSVPEALLTVLKDDFSKKLAQSVAWADVVVAGPGIGTGERSEKYLRGLVEAAKDKVLVLDADALNLLSTNQELQNMIKSRKLGTTVLTPHPGELSRLTGERISVLKENFPAPVIDYAKKLQCIVVAKDAVSAVVTPEGKIYLCDSGNDGMATAGTGDVLAGMVGALCAGCVTQASRNAENASCEIAPFGLAEAVTAAVYMHGMAGTQASEELTKEGVMAGDLITYLPEVIRRIRQ